MESSRTFTLERCLGRGGFGEVYLAEMASRGGMTTSVALKVLRRDLAPDGAAVQRLRDEGRHLARLDHPTILRVFDQVVLDGRVALVTEYVAGEDLEGCLRGVPRIPPRASFEVVGRVASALDAAWTAPLGVDGGPLRLAHRDVKPSNIRIGRFGEVKLLDFGIARSDEVTREARTQTDMIVGSPPYMAPERFLDNKVRLASDVFALGATLFEGLAGERAFDLPVTMLAAHAVDAGRHARHVDARLATLPADTPPAWAELVRAMLAHDPDARPTAAEVVRRCEELVDSASGPTLAEWARAYPFTLRTIRGELDGKQLTAEGTFELPAPPVAAPTGDTARSATWTGVVVGSLSLLSVSSVGIGAAFVIALVVSAWAFSGTGDPTPPAPVPVQASPMAPVPDPGPDPVPDPVPDPAPDPLPTLPDPVAAPDPAPSAPDPRPRPVQPAPTPEPVAPAPKVDPKPAKGQGRVDVVGEFTRAELSRGGERVRVPGEVAAGTWTFDVTFSTGLESKGSVVVPASGAVVLDCKPRMGRCTVR